jgi:N-acetylglucosamine-6-phosphate deacetylase
MIAITNVQIVTPFRSVEDSAILIDGKKIRAVGRMADVNIPKDAEVHDFRGCIATPGFVDLLVHGGGGAGFSDVSDDAISTASEYYFKHGTTGLLGALYSKPEDDMIRTVSRLADYAEKHAGETNVWGMHLEGPFINPELHGAMKTEYLWEPSLERWSKLWDAGRGFIRLMTIAPELPGSADVLRDAAGKGVVLSVGHSTATYDQVIQGIDNGIAHVTHMFNAMNPFHHRTPSVITAAMLRNELKVELIADGVHVHPAVMRLIFNVKGSGGIVLVTDAIRASGMKDGEYTFMDQTIIVKDAKALLTDGTLAGSTLTMNRAVKTMVEDVHVPLTDAIRMASLNGAKVLGRSQTKGILAVGKDADIVVMDMSYDVKLTMFEGAVKHIS